MPSDLRRPDGVGVAVGFSLRMSVRWRIVHVMFTGLTDIDWSSLTHAYGTAEDVPQDLLDLASDDPSVREIALHNFFGAVHHQGDIYDSTVACLPFLFELAADSSRPGRGPVVELLVSIGQSAVDWHSVPDVSESDASVTDACGPDAAEAAVPRTPYVQAYTLIWDRVGEFVPLLADQDPEVRSAAPAALALFAVDGARTVGLFEERLAEESEIECRIALVRAAADLAAREDAVAAIVGDWLQRIIDEGADPGVRLAALAYFMRLAPERQGAGIGAKAIALLREISEYPGYVPAPPDDRPATPTLIGIMRVWSARERDGRADAWTAGLLGVLHDALDDRVSDRIALVEDQLRHPDPGRRVDAVRLGSQLIRGWRGPFEHLIEMIGGQLAASQQHVRAAAASALEGIFELAAPAGPALVEQVTAFGPQAWNDPSDGIRDVYRKMLLALVRLGDPRAVPGIALALNDSDDTTMLVQSLGGYRAHAGVFAQALLERVARVPRELNERHDTALHCLLVAIRELGIGEALPHVQRILDDAVRSRSRWAVDGALDTLKSFGAGSAAALPRVRELRASDDTSVSFLAAETAWSITGDPDEVVPTLASWLGTETQRAARVAGRIGRPAASLAARIRPLLASDMLWPRVEAAVALARIAEEFEPALPIFVAAWQANPYTRTDIAECVAVPGAPAAPLLPLLHAELAAPQRHNRRVGAYGTHDIADDEQLLRLCRTAIEHIG